MSRKKIVKPGQPKSPLDDIDIDILEYPKEHKVNTDRGAAIYHEALTTLVARFERSSMKGNPEALASNVIHQVITFVTQLVPEDFNNQPANIPELAAIFGAAIGMGAAPALDRGEVTIAQIEELVDCFYVAMREGIPRGILIARKVDEQMRQKKFGGSVH